MAIANSLQGSIGTNPVTGVAQVVGPQPTAQGPVLGPIKPAAITQPAKAPVNNQTFGFLDGSSYNTAGQQVIAPKVSTTTISNQNKIEQVPSIINTTNNLSKTGVTTDANGNAVYANGTLVPQLDSVAPANLPKSTSTTSTGGYIGEMYYPPGAELPKGSDGKPLQTTPTSPTDDQIMASLNDMKAQNDAITASIIESIQAQYANLRQQQERANRSSEAGVKNALLMGGVTGKGSSSQYAPISSEGIVSAQVNYGIQQIAELNSKEQLAISQAKIAGQQANYQLMDKINNQISKIRDEKVAAATKLADKIAEQNEKLKEQQLQQTKDTAVAELYDSGITDPTQILSNLKKNGLVITSNEVSQILKNISPEKDSINKIMAEASVNGAPLEIIAAIGKSRNTTEAIMAAGEYTRDPLDVAYKKAQIAKIYNDIDSSGVGGAFGGDASQAIAYAQQYASTGQIPTNLPKGTFGVIAQIAKELPKANGEIVDNYTGVKPSTLTGTQVDAYGALRDLTNKLEEAKTLFSTLKKTGQTGSSGIIGALTGAVFPSKTKQAYDILRGEIIDLLARARSGAALTANEEANYKAKLPGTLNQFFGLGADGITKLSGVQGSIASKLDTSLKASGTSMYGFSKVNTPLGELIVGSTVNLPDGTSGRINPDGTVTQL